MAAYGRLYPRGPSSAWFRSIGVPFLSCSGFAASCYLKFDNLEGLRSHGRDFLCRAHLSQEPPHLRRVLLWEVAEQQRPIRLLACRQPGVEELAAEAAAKALVSAKLGHRSSP